MSDQLPSSSSADKVASNDDLLTEILLRLPVKSLLRFKSVSKHYYFLISNPRFKSLRIRNPDPPSGLIVPAHFNKTHIECEFISFSIENPVKSPFKALDFAPNIERIDIVDSCNGLMLCSSQGADLMEDNMYHVSTKYHIYNPTVNQFDTIHMFNNYEISNYCGMTLAFDPSKSLHYRIIYVYAFGRSNDADGIQTCYSIQIYSSDTRTCDASYTFSLDEDYVMDFQAGIYWKNAVHWIQKAGFVLYFNLDNGTIHKIQTSFARLSLDHTISSYLFESRDHLLVVEIPNPFNSKFTVHELKGDYSGWFVKYRVDLEEVARSFPEIVNGVLPQGMFRFVVLCIVLGEKEDDSFLVLEIPEKVLRFNLVSKTFYKLHDFSFPRSLNSDEVLRQRPHVFQFVESLYSL